MSLFKLQDGQELNYEVVNSVLPQPTFFIHGNIASNNWWKPTLTEFKTQFSADQAKAPMIMAEFKGCGGSSIPKSEADVSMHLFAEQFVELAKSLEPSLGGQKLNLVGHSTGGLIAALMLAQASELFNKAILLDPVGAEGVKFDNSMIAAFEAMKNDRSLTAVVLGSTIYNNKTDDGFFAQTLVDDAYKAVKAVGHWVLRALDGLDVREELKTVKNQVLVLHGEHDNLLPIEESKKMAKLMPNAMFEVIPCQGHCANIENPKAWTQIVSKFLFL